MSGDYTKNTEGARCHAATTEHTSMNENSRHVSR